MLPCYNERSVIDKVLQEIEDLGAEYETIVIDDGSIDDTFTVASSLSPSVTTNSLVAE